jgi:ubiquinone/menaquinone biosynthesis C-methylase UbiE
MRRGAARGGLPLTIEADLQPDQRAERWDDHVRLYEEAFEPLSLAFARRAIARLEPRPGMRVLDLAAGPGAAALALAEGGVAVTAIDGSSGMTERLRRRAEAAGSGVEARTMDGLRLAFPDAAFDAALSVFGVVLFPDAARGLAEMRRVVRPGGSVALVTWTEPERYELAAALRAAIDSLGPVPPPAGPLPAQLRFAAPEAFERLFTEAGFGEVAIETAEAELHAPSALWLAERIRFAPGMDAWLSGLGDREAAAIAALVARLDREHGRGPLRLKAVALIGVGRG